jgi:hypothetical protein
MTFSRESRQCAASQQGLVVGMSMKGNDDGHVGGFLLSGLAISGLAPRCSGGECSVQLDESVELCMGAGGLHLRSGRHRRDIILACSSWPETTFSALMNRLGDSSWWFGRESVGSVAVVVPVVGVAGVGVAGGCGPLGVAVAGADGPGGALLQPVVSTAEALQVAATSLLVP